MKRIFKLLKPVFVVLIVVFCATACDKNNDFLLFSIEDDKKLGKQVSEQIADDPDQFPVLSKTEYAKAYQYMDAMRDKILNSGEVSYKKEFAWEMHIIDKDVLNAFVTPAGYIYVYTGLIKYLDTADDLAGVLGHEVAHADLRHSSKSLQKQYGVQILLGILLGDNASDLKKITGQVAGTLAGLSFSREFEKESDAKSVEYLALTDYACNGAASFFAKLKEQEQSGGSPEFLSTHPDSDSRVADINKKALSENCSTKKLDESESSTAYEEFQTLFK